MEKAREGYFTILLMCVWGDAYISQKLKIFVILAYYCAIHSNSSSFSTYSDCVVLYDLFMIQLCTLVSLFTHLFYTAPFSNKTFFKHKWKAEVSIPHLSTRLKKQLERMIFFRVKMCREKNFCSLVIKQLMVIRKAAYTTHSLTLAVCLYWHKIGKIGSKSGWYSNYTRNNTVLLLRTNLPNF